MSKRAPPRSRLGGLMTRLMPWLLACLPLMAVADAPAAPGPAQRSAENREVTTSIAPRPFKARYRLEVKGWPAAYVDHRLSHEGDYWESLMETGIRVARGSERSRFLLENGGIQALYYASGYMLLGVGDSYSLSSDRLTRLPDRQTALFALSRRIIDGDCAGSSCDIRYLDHKGREEALRVRAQGRSRITLPAGTFEALTVEAREADKPDRRLVFHFHPEVPGLLLAVDYHRGDERRSHLALSELSVLE
ncbi:hypothetical protein [Halomonas alimentaria]|uniref:hypothetical protein n=1 Tax=Halomonas alimentaria TaxID=147248 RepID=UPI0024915A01|nr:hypothetical protein [Halomonas alimentaria]